MISTTSVYHLDGRVEPTMECVDLDLVGLGCELRLFLRGGWHAS